MSNLRTTPEAQAALVGVADAVIAGKKWYLSKTVWANGVAFLGVLVQTKYGYVIDPGSQALILALANQWLRKISSEPIIW